jgi:hypothetical protein
MADEKKTAAPDIAAIVPERANFKTLILGNPNYFGTFPKLGAPVKPKSFDTAFEQLMCLGLNPQQDRLEAVVDIKRNSGYNTDACGGGSVEYVRFYVQQGASWVDLGVASFNVYNLAGTPLPLSYSCSIICNEARKFCNAENILNVRAILSWEIEPPPGDAGFSPPWGNVVDARVQVAAAQYVLSPLSTLISEGVVTIDKQALSEVDVTKVLPAKAQTALSYDALKAAYANTKVPPHRYGFVEVQKLLQEPILQVLPQVAAVGDVKAAQALKPASALAKLSAGPELGAILGAIAIQFGDTSYEQLMCAGFNPQTGELEGVIQIKQNGGYSGGLCTAGSTEYVSFFAFVSGSWQPLGTGTVNVHDLAAVIPGHPVMYAVYRISNFTEMPCKDLTGVPLRAILSWQTPPTGPDFIPVWGNVINTHVQPIIGTPTSVEKIELFRVGGVTVDFIHDSDHLAYQTPMPPATGPLPAGDCAGNQSPFGGDIIVEGQFTVKPDVFDHTTGVVVGNPLIYQAWITRTDIASAPFQLTNSFGIALYPPDALFPPVPVTQSVKPAPGPVVDGVAGTQYYQYMESNVQAVVQDTLAVFEAGGLAEGDYQIEIRGWAWDGSNYMPVLPSQDKTVHVFNGYPHTEYINTGGTLIPFTAYRPQVAISLTSVPDCASAPVGTILTGSYSVTDKFFSGVSIALVPIDIGGSPALENAVAITPDAGFPTSFDGAATSSTGSHGTFTLKTAGMTPCGYTILLQANDRTIVNNLGGPFCYNHWNDIGVGFCLTPPASS